MIVSPSYELSKVTDGTAVTWFKATEMVGIHPLPSMEKEVSVCPAIAQLRKEEHWLGGYGRMPPGD